MKTDKYTANMVLDQIAYTCDLWNKGCFDHLEDFSVFVNSIKKLCNAEGKTERYINRILEKDLHLNG